MKMLALAVVLAAPSVNGQTTWQVDDVAQQGIGTTASPFNSIQYAIDQPTTVDGDTIQVAPGTYLENIDLGGKSIAIVGSDNPSLPTIIDGGSQHASTVRIATGEGPGTRLAWLEITGGYDGVPSQVGDNGGGVYCSGVSVTMEDCQVRSNGIGLPPCCPGAGWPSGAYLGGGLFADNCTLTIRRTVFAGNIAESGAGLYLTDCDSDLTDVVIEGNASGAFAFTGGPAGFLALGGHFSMLRCRVAWNYSFCSAGGGAVAAETCTIDDSSIENNFAWCSYGGMSIAGPAVVTNTTFANNEAIDDPIGACGVSGGVEFYSCTFEGNRAGNISFPHGGGLFASGPGNTAEKCLFLNNHADVSGAALYGAIKASNCVFVGNQSDAGAVAAGDVLQGFPVLNNCIAIDNGVNPIGLGVQVTYSLVEGGSPGDGNIDGDPQFLFGTYNLLSSSPCIDAGDPASPLDLDGSPADIGTYSFADCDGNGVVDSDDIASGLAPDANANWIIDECECRATNYCIATTNSTGSAASIANSGSLSVSVNDLVLLASGLPANEFGIFYYGQGQTESPFGDGNRCVFGTLTRLQPPAMSDALGMAAYVVDSTNPAHDPFGRITPTTTLHFQYWYRDPNGGPAGFNLSDGLSLTFCP